MNRTWRLGPVAVCALLGGCSAIIPGLHLRYDTDDHDYKIVDKADGTGYAVEGTKEGHGIPYTVEELDPHVLSVLAMQDQAESKDQLPGVLPSDVPAEYRIGPGDELYITVWDHPELTSPNSAGSTNTATLGRLVDSSGNMFYPYVGTFKVAGMTMADLRKYLTDHLDAVIKNPQLDARVLTFRASRVEVSGEVAHPGTVTLSDTPIGVLQAINLAGGLVPTTASHRRAYLLRHGHVYQLDLAALLSGDRPAANPALEPGDTLHIPDQSGDQVFLLGALNKQQPMILQETSNSLMSALTQVGGLGTGSNQSEVLVFRVNRAPSSGLHAYVYHLDLSRADQFLLAGEFQLHPGDVIYVQTTPLALYNNAVELLLPTVTTLFEIEETKLLLGQ